MSYISDKTVIYLFKEYTSASGFMCTVELLIETLSTRERLTNFARFFVSKGYSLEGYTEWIEEANKKDPEQLAKDLLALW